MSDAENISKVTDIINDSRIGMFTTVNEAGALVSRPLAVQDVKDDGDMWFFTSATTSQVAHVRAHPGVNVSFGKGTEWVQWPERRKSSPTARRSTSSGTRWLRPGSRTARTPRRWSCCTLIPIPPNTGPARAEPPRRCCSGSSPRSLHSRMSVGESGTVEL